MSKTIKKFGYDPKNRKVTLSEIKVPLSDKVPVIGNITTSTHYKVEKPETGFNSGKIVSLEDSLEIYNQKLHCSQNQ